MDYVTEKGQFVKKDNKMIPLNPYARLLDLAAGRVVAVGEGHDDVVSTVAISRDGRVGVSATREGQIFSWELAR